jgi:hypothetical protein
MTPEQLDRLARWWRRHLIARDALIIGGVAVAAAALTLPWSSALIVIPLAIAAFASAFALRLFFSSAWKIDVAQVTRHLDRSFPQLEESSALLLRAPESLTLLQRLQRQRVQRAAQAMQRAAGGVEFAAPRGLLRVPLWCFAAAAVVFIGVALWCFVENRRPDDVAPSVVPSAPVVQATPATPLPTPAITRADMVITPPAYTGRAERRVSGLTAEVEEGATVSWSVAFDQAVDEAELIFGERDVVPLRLEGESLAGRRVTNETSLYHAAGVLRDGTAWRSADLHSLKVVKDQPASLKILQPNLPRTVIDPPASRVTVEVLATDDYGIKDAHLIATVAKGTGEAVKFREQQIAFDAEEAVADAANGRRFTKVLDLAALGLEPGDELYFHVVARDNREPANNQSRSETRFIVLRGPEQEISTPGAGVAGVNLIPEYFRSQRQIIIDTEKLIAERTNLPEQEFTRRSNDLGIDQQLLRQRYGQFLGQEEHFEGDGHDHAAMIESGTLTHDQVVERFGHKHDSEDEATFFQGEAKATMRDALAAMWEAEGLLRTARPEDALAPENRALEILKVLQQSDRAYVQRVGFEAAPLNVPERRLRGDVSAVPARAVEPASQQVQDADEIAVRDALRRPDQLEALRKSEAAFTKAATNDPGRFLNALQILRRRLAGTEPLRASDAAELQRALLRMLPPTAALPHRVEELSPSLAKSYFENLGDDE